MTNGCARTDVPRVAPGSFLHRALKITPGFAPTSLCSQDNCGGMDLLAFLGGVIAFAGFPAAKFGFGWWWPVLGIAVAALFLSRISVPFHSRERWGRVRRRRGECVWCGAPSIPPGSDCFSCGLLNGRA